MSRDGLSKTIRRDTYSTSGPQSRTSPTSFSIRTIPEHYCRLKANLDTSHNDKYANPVGRLAWQVSQEGGEGEPFYVDPHGFQRGLDMWINAGKDVYAEKWDSSECALVDNGVTLKDIDVLKSLNKRSSSIIRFARIGNFFRDSTLVFALRAGFPFETSSPSRESSACLCGHRHIAQLTVRVTIHGVTKSITNLANRLWTTATHPRRTYASTASLLLSHKEPTKSHTRSMTITPGRVAAHVRCAKLTDLP
ncbi:hypothetical protein G7K_3130-t1 [Saitoella complicata NRRL Y-17804]|uniref:Uncharacterized protein n=1 Tax=Saitoella complicata (strain BCRC 22490 / CBS 7301 / JCM 7358 / NBRC 10748 / NRRL Y-17804) TaxID=698492 RepID=A0A0E9NGK7_SAICN|nr:hypothetical protein G7K_3130-t1 [Saitoella complicata NRRL Y-17804]